MPRQPRRAQKKAGIGMIPIDLVPRRKRIIVGHKNDKNSLGGGIVRKAMA